MFRVLGIMLLLASTAAAAGAEPSLFDSSGRRLGDPGTSRDQCKTIAQWADMAVRSRSFQNRVDGCTSLELVSGGDSLTPDDVVEFEKVATALIRSEDVRVRRVGFIAIGTLKLTTSEDACLAIVKAKDLGSLPYAVEALGGLGSKKAIPAMLNIFPLRDARGNTAACTKCDMAIAGALGRIGGDEAKAALETIRRKTRDDEVRELIDLELDKLAGIGK